MLTMRPLPLLALAIAIVGANSLILPPIAALVAGDLQSPPEAVIRAMAAYGAGTALSALLLAPRADRIGAGRALRQATALLILALSLSALAPDITWLILGHALAGIGAGMALPAIYGLTAQVSPPGQEKRSLSLVLSGWTFALVGGVVLASSLAELLGWRPIYALLAGLTACVWWLLGRSEMLNLRGSGRVSTPFSALRVPGVWAALCSNALLMLAFFGAYSLLGLHITTELGRSAAAAGLATMCYGIGFGAALWLEPLLPHASLRQSLNRGFLGLALAYGLLALAVAHFALLLAFALLWGISQHLALNAVLARLNRLDPDQRGAIMGLNSASTYLCVTGGALAFPLPYAWGGLAACLVVSALCACLASAEALRARITD